MLVMLSDLIKTVDANVNLTQSLFLQGVVEKEGVSQGQQVLLLLFGVCSLDQGRQSLLVSEGGQLEKGFIDVFARLGCNEIDPISASALECVLDLLVFEDPGVGLKFLRELRPEDERLFVELLNGEVHTLVEAGLFERCR